MQSFPREIETTEKWCPVEVDMDDLRLWKLALQATVE
jgi:hypothetical protein